MGIVRGFFGVQLLTAGLLGGAMLGLFPAALLVFVLPGAAQVLTAVVSNLWGYFICGITERWYGVRFVVSGDELPTSGRLLVFSNHRTRLDWLFLWALSLHSGLGSAWRIILKAGLKNVPFFGWALQQFDFMFIERSLDQDHSHMTGMLSKYATLKDYMLLIFPEGTDLSDKNLERSRMFAKTKGLEQYHYVLHPRLKGWWVCLDNLGSSIDEVIDLSVAYKGPMPQSEAALIKAKTPTEVHIHVNRMKLSEVPHGTEEESAEWMRSRFAAKEKQLEQFYANGSFDNTGGRPCRLNSTKVYTSFAFFLGLFVLEMYLAFCHRFVLFVVTFAYFAFFKVLFKTHGGFDKYMLKRWRKARTHSE